MTTENNAKIIALIMQNKDIKAFYEKGILLATNDEQKQAVMCLSIAMIPEAIQLLGTEVYNKCKN